MHEMDRSTFHAATWTLVASWICLRDDCYVHKSKETAVRDGGNACGAPVIATRVDVAPKLVSHGVCGDIVSPEQVEPLRNKTFYLAHDPERCAAMGRKAVKRADARFDVSATARQYESVYRELLARRARGRSAATC